MDFFDQIDVASEPLLVSIKQRLSELSITFRTFFKPLERRATQETLHQPYMPRDPICVRSDPSEE